MLEQDLKKSLEVLKKGGVILYPTDTVWGLGCDATNFEAVQKIFNLKQREDSKTMICMVHDFNMLNKHVEDVPSLAKDIIKIAQKPTTIIYDRPKHVAENLIAADNTLAIRVVHHNFCETLIRRFKKPIVSTSANLSGHPTPTTFQEIETDILKGVDYVVNLGRDQKAANPSSIIQLSNDGTVKVIRQ